MEKKILIFLANGHEEIEAITQIDLLRRAGITVATIGLTGKEIKGAHDITVMADYSMDEIPSTYDAVIIPGGLPGTTFLMESEAVCTIVLETYKNKKLVGAICAAPLVLNAVGILEGKKFTCYPGVEKSISKGTFINQSVVQDGNIITSRGIGTAIPFGLALVEFLLGETNTNDLAKEIVFAR